MTCSQPVGLVLCVTAMPLFYFQTKNMSIQSLRYLKASRNRWFTQRRHLVSYETSWHSCSLGSTPTMHLFCVVHLKYSGLIVVYFLAVVHSVSHCLSESKTLVHFLSEYNRALQFQKSQEWLVLWNTVCCTKLPLSQLLIQSNSNSTAFPLDFHQLIICSHLPASPFVPPTHPSARFSDLYFTFCLILAGWH